MNTVQIVDSHHHLWDTNELNYTLFDSVPTLRRPYTLTDFDREVATQRTAASICVEAASAGADGRHEAEWLLRATADSERVRALVAWAPLDQPDCESYLDWLLTLVGKPIVGVRRSFESEAPDFAEHPVVIANAKAAGERDLVVDLVLFPHSLPSAIRLVEACPDTQFVLDHLGKPRIRDRLLEPWASQIHELSRSPNVVCKLSGLPTEADRSAWTTSDLRPYVDQALASFGPARLLYGSDWPVVNLAGGLLQWLNAVTSLVADLSPNDHIKVFATNTKRVYRLEDPAS